MFYRERMDAALALNVCTEYLKKAFPRFRIPASFSAVASSCNLGKTFLRYSTHVYYRLESRHDSIDSLLFVPPPELSRRTAKKKGHSLLDRLYVPISVVACIPAFLPSFLPSFTHSLPSFFHFRCSIGPFRSAACLRRTRAATSARRRRTRPRTSSSSSESWVSSWERVKDEEEQVFTLIAFPEVEE